MLSHMNKLPGRETVLGFLRTHGTDSETAVLLENARKMIETFHEKFRAVPVAVRLVEPFPGRWSPQEILDHVVECHRCAPEQLRRVARGEPCTETIRAFVQSAAPHAHAWGALLREFRTIHDEILAAATVLAETPPPAHGLKIEMLYGIEVDGKVRDKEHREELDWKAYLEALRFHLGQHIKQLERTLEQIG